MNMGRQPYQMQHGTGGRTPVKNTNVWSFCYTPKSNCPTTVPLVAGLCCRWSHVLATDCTDSIPQKVGNLKMQNGKVYVLALSKFVKFFSGICKGDRKMGNKTEYDEISQIIRDAKQERNLTNQQLATAANVPQSFVNKLLAAGTSGSANAFYLASICEVLGLSMDDLLGLPKQEDPGQEDAIAILRTEIEHRDALLDEKDKRIKMMQKGIQSRRTLIYSLTGLCVLLAAALAAYVILDALNPAMGLIRQTGTNIGVYLMAMAIIGVCLYIGHSMVKRWNKKLREEQNHEQS